MEERERVMEAALRLLDFKDRTVKELRDKLIKKGYPEELVQETVDQLKEYGALDDRRYAENMTRNRLSDGKGSRYIKNKLMQKGISGDDIDYGMDAGSEGLDEGILCLKKALSLCHISELYEITEDGEIVPDVFAGSDRVPDQGELRYFYRKIDEDETDRQLIFKEHEKARSSLLRRLVSAGFSLGHASEAVRKIDRL